MQEYNSRYSLPKPRFLFCKCSFRCVYKGTSKGTKTNLKCKKITRDTHSRNPHFSSANVQSAAYIKALQKVRRRISNTASAFEIAIAKLDRITTHTPFSYSSYSYSPDEQKLAKINTNDKRRMKLQWLFRNLLLVQFLERTTIQYDNMED